MRHFGDLGVDSGTCPNPAGYRNGILGVQKASKKIIEKRINFWSNFGNQKTWFWVSFLVKFKTFLKARAEMVEALICAHSPIKNHVFVDPGELKRCDFVYNVRRRGERHF